MHDPAKDQPPAPDRDEELERTTGIAGAIHESGVANDPAIAEEAAEASIGVGGEGQGVTGESGSSAEKTEE